MYILKDFEFFFITFLVCSLRDLQYYINFIQVGGLRIVNIRVNVNSPETKIGVNQI